MEYQWYHLLPVIFTLINFNNTKLDILQSVIPKHDMNNMYYMLLSIIPIILLRNASLKHIEHLIILLCMSTGLKALHTQITPNDSHNHDYFFILTVACILISINYSLIPRTSTFVYLLYVYMFSYALIQISLRKKTTSNLLQDFMITHFIFFFSK